MYKDKVQLEEKQSMLVEPQLSSDVRVHVVQEKSADVTVNNIVDDMAALVRQAQTSHDNASELRRHFSDG